MFTSVVTRSRSLLVVCFRVCCEKLYLSAILIYAGVFFSSEFRGAASFGKKDWAFVEIQKVEGRGGIYKSVPEGR